MIEFINLHHPSFIITIIACAGLIYFLSYGRKVRSGLASRIKQIRKHYNLTESEFAARLGLKTEDIKKLEAGWALSNDITPMHTVNMLLYCAFRVDYDWNMLGQGEMLNTDIPDNKIRFYTVLCHLYMKDRKALKELNITAKHIQSDLTQEQTIKVQELMDAKYNNQWLKTGNGKMLKDDTEDN